MTVLDASAAVLALRGEGPTRQRLADETLHAPHLIDAEVAQTLRKLAHRGELPPAGAARALWAWQRFSVQRHASVEHLARAWSLRDNVSAYDALYVALAESLDCSLITSDARLGRAPGVRCPVDVVRF